MAGLTKTIVATGASSGLGFELVKQLLQQQTSAYRLILGVRNTKTTETALDALNYDKNKHSVKLLPLELSNLRGVRSFASETLATLSADGRPVDYLLLNAGMLKGSEGPGPNGSKWCESYLHYLIHLLREKLIESKSRVVVVSSGAVRTVRDQNPATVEGDIKAGSGAESWVVYGATKFTQLLGAHWWRRHLKDTDVKVVAVSPGLIPGTNFARHTKKPFDVNSPDAKTVPEGAQNIFRAFTRDDFPEDPDQIFLTSWGEWWSKDVIQLSLDKALQDKWSPSKEEIEKDEGLNA